MEFTTDEKMKFVYKFDKDIIDRIIELHSIVKEQKQIDISLENFIELLQQAMYYNKMRMWLLENHTSKVSFNDKFKKFFELESNEDILEILNVEQTFSSDLISNEIKK